MRYSTVVCKTLSTVSRAALCALLGLCLMAGLLPKAGASTLSPFIVTHTADDTLPGSLRSAITLAAASGGTVTFAIPTTDAGYSSTTNTDTITLSLGPLVVLGSLSIAGPAAPSTTVIVSGANSSRVFSVTGGTVAFSSLTITNGSAIQGSVNFPEPEDGGGILNTATLTLTNCVIVGNASNSGGGAGINNKGANASLTMTNCTVSQNMGTFTNGGGIANSGTLTITGCLISGNSVAGNVGNAASGGGLFNSGTATLNTSTLSGNSASPDNTALGRGGAGAYNTGSLTLNNCLVSGNSTLLSGGGINNSGGTLTLSACTISSNSSGRGFNNSGVGGGIYNVAAAQMTNCLVVNNIGYSVAGMYNGGTLTLINSTFTGNLLTFAANFGGNGVTGGGLVSGPATLVNDIFAFDTSNINGTATSSEIVASDTAGPTITYSDVQGGYPGTGNINADPQFVRNPDRSTGDLGDEHLKLSSPAVHTGTNGQGVPLTDIEGTPRPTPPATPSMGAYEVSGSSSGFSAQGGFVVAGTQNQGAGPQVVAKFLSGTTAAASFTATVDMGDGSVISGIIAPDPNVAGVYQVTVSHTYAAYGPFTITVTISGPNNTPTATVTSTANIQPAQVATDATGQVSVFRGGFYYNRFTKRYSQTVTIKNTSSAAITGPISLSLDNLTAGAAALNATGTTQYAPPAGSSYFTVQAGSLASGATTSLFLQLINTSGSQINYTPRILAGPGAR